MSIAVRTPDKRVDARDVGSRAEPDECVASGGELESSRLLVAERTASCREEHARSCHFVWRLELLPQLQRAPQLKKGAPSIALRCCHSPDGLSSHCKQHLACMIPGELIKFARCEARPVEAAGIQLDLDLRRKQRRAPNPRVRFGKSPPNRSCGGDLLPLP